MLLPINWRHVAIWSSSDRGWKVNKSRPYIVLLYRDGIPDRLVSFQMIKVSTSLCPTAWDVCIGTFTWLTLKYSAKTTLFRSVLSIHIVPSPSPVTSTSSLFSRPGYGSSSIKSHQMIMLGLYKGLTSVERSWRIHTWPALWSSRRWWWTKSGRVTVGANTVTVRKIATPNKSLPLIILTHFPQIGWQD